MANLLQHVRHIGASEMMNLSYLYIYIYMLLRIHLQGKN